MTGLTEPDFIDREPADVTAAIIADYENLTGKTLYPAQAERLWVDVAAYRETLVRIGIQEAAKLNLVAYSTFPVLDHLGRLVGVSRLDAQPARTTLRFTLDAAREYDTAIPAGVRVQAKGGEHVFATEAVLVVPAGETTGETVAVCDAEGMDGNGFEAGEIATLMDAVSHVAAAVNVTVSSGGADREDDERLRERIQAAPSSFAAAGPVGAYRFHAKSAHQDIVDVAVWGPDEHGRPGEIDVYPLTVDGAPSAEIKALVAAALAPADVRPTGDKVSVLDPVAIEYAIAVSIVVEPDADTDDAVAATTEALQAIADTWAAGLARDIRPGALTKAAMGVDGVHDAETTSPSYTDMAGNAWARCTGITVTATGVDGDGG